MTRTTNSVLRFLADERPELPARLEILRCFSHLAGWIIVLLTVACFFRTRVWKPKGRRQLPEPKPFPIVALRCHLPTVAFETKVSATMHSERMALWSTP